MAASGWYKDARVIVVALHTLGIAAITVWVALQFPQNHDAGMAWVPCVFFDFPAILLMRLIGPLLPEVLGPSPLSEHFEVTVIPAVLFAVVGGLQWYVITSAFLWAVGRKDRSRCRTCGYALRGLPEPRCPECGTPFDAALLKELHESGD